MYFRTSYILSAALFVLFSLSALSYAQSNGPIKDSIDSPDYVLAPDTHGFSIESQQRLDLNFPSDYSSCQDHYGPTSNYMAGCARDRKLAGRKVDTGVSMMPPIAGVWRWTSD